MQYYYSSYQSTYRCHTARPLRIYGMRAVVQRVKTASVEVNGQVVSRIGPGLLCLIGIKAGDSDKDAEFICRRMLNCRLWPGEDDNKSWDQSVVQKGYEILLVSQFTLYGLMKGNKPDFHLAMPPKQADEAYGKFLKRVQAAYLSERVKDGVFGAMMDVSLINDGPVTMSFDSENPGGR